MSTENVVKKTREHTKLATKKTAKKAVKKTVTKAKGKAVKKTVKKTVKKAVKKTGKLAQSIVDARTEASKRAGKKIKSVSVRPITGDLKSLRGLRLWVYTMKLVCDHLIARKKQTQIFEKDFYDVVEQQTKIDVAAIHVGDLSASPIHQGVYGLSSPENALLTSKGESSWAFIERFYVMREGRMGYKSGKGYVYPKLKKVYSAPSPVELKKACYAMLLDKYGTLIESKIPKQFRK